MEKEWRIYLRRGDTSPAKREKFRKHGAEYVVTTPESLAVMLAQESYTQHFRDCEFVIIDDLHCFAGNKRGADLTISLERLEHLRKKTVAGIADAGSEPDGRSRSAQKTSRAAKKIA